MKQAATAEALIDYVGSNAGELVELGGEMERLYGGGFTDLMVNGAAAGNLNFWTITLDQERIAVIWFWVSRGNAALCINAIKALVERDVSSALMVSLDRLAAKMECKTIQFVTGRLGLVRKAQRLGYEVRGIYLERQLSAPASP